MYWKFQVAWSLEPARVPVQHVTHTLCAWCSSPWTLLLLPLKSSLESLSFPRHAPHPLTTGEFILPSHASPAQPWTPRPVKMPAVRLTALLHPPSLPPRYVPSCLRTSLSSRLLSPRRRSMGAACSGLCESNRSCS
jgi:hypothetical protein